VPSLNLAVCWELLRALSTITKVIVKILKIGQSAGNQRDFSSRILRDYTLSIDKFTYNKDDIISDNSITKDKINLSRVIPNADLGAYLAGLTEGDGYIEVNLNHKEGNRKTNPRFVFTFNENNLFLYEHIKNRIRSGFFVKVKPNNMYYEVGIN
jgi:hypothetical protein